VLQKCSLSSILYHNKAAGCTISPPGSSPAAQIPCLSPGILFLRQCINEHLCTSCYPVGRLICPGAKNCCGASNDLVWKRLLPSEYCGYFVNRSSSFNASKC
jgi:hypothetical protein